MKNLVIRNAYWFFCILLFISSCKEDILPKETSQPKMCVNVKDQLTNLPVEGASVEIYVEASDGSGTGLTGVTDATGNANIEYFDYIYLNEINVTAAGYERTCKYLSFDRNIATTRDMLLLKRTGYIQIHGINQLPSYIIDSTIIIVTSHLDECVNFGYGYQFVGKNIDSLVNYSAIAGSNSIKWMLYRYNSLISDSTFDVNVTTGDTTFVQIDY